MVAKSHGHLNEDSYEWHIFVILIVSCIITLVAPSNLIIIASIGMEVYKSSLKFQADCIYTSQDMVFLKSWFSHTFCIVMGNPCPSQYKMYGKTMILKIPYLVMCICNLLEILKDICRPPYL